jgi:hypothetical protein
MLTLLLAASLAHAAPDADAFHPGLGPATVRYGALLRAGKVRGRTGNVLVGLDAAHHAGWLVGQPGIASVYVLGSGALRVTPLPGTDDLALARRLHDTPGVRWAHPDLLVRVQPAAGMPDDPWVTDQWHLENTGQGGRTVDSDIDATTAWAFASGAGQFVAILDSGVQVDHPDLVVQPGHDYVGRDEDPSPDAADGWGAPHGTSAAGVAAAIGGDARGGAGVAYDADIYALRIIGGSNNSLEDLQSAFVEAVDAGAGVLSNSWGWGDCSEIPAYGVFDEMFTYAEVHGRGGLGSVVVFAAGNGNCDIVNDGMLAQPSLIVVAAVEGNDVRAGYSSYGASVDIAAPTSILTTDVTPGGYGSYQGDDAWADGFGGTSAATPVVSGTVALMLEANPRLRARDVREVLCATATRIDLAHAGYDASGWSPYYGCGRVDAGAAVAAVANAAPGVPTPLTVDGALDADGGVLRWESALDPDGEPLAYDVRWRRSDDTESVQVRAPEVSFADGTHALDLRDTLAPGEVVTWSVRAVDAWGAGPWSEEVTWTIAELPEVVPVADALTPAPEGGCATAPRAGKGPGVQGATPPGGALRGSAPPQESRGYGTSATILAFGFTVALRRRARR